MIYRIPLQPPWLSRCWVDHPARGWLAYEKVGTAVKSWRRVEPNRPVNAPVSWYSWRELLEVGSITDVDPT